MLCGGVNSFACGDGNKVKEKVHEKAQKKLTGLRHGSSSRHTGYRPRRKVIFFKYAHFRYEEEKKVCV